MEQQEAKEKIKCEYCGCEFRFKNYIIFQGKYYHEKCNLFEMNNK